VPLRDGRAGHLENPSDPKGAALTIRSPRRCNPPRGRARALPVRQRFDAVDVANAMMADHEGSRRALLIYRACLAVCMIEESHRGCRIASHSWCANGEKSPARPPPTITRKAHRHVLRVRERLLDGIAIMSDSPCRTSCFLSAICRRLQASLRMPATASDVRYGSRSKNLLACCPANHSADALRSSLQNLHHRRQSAAFSQPMTTCYAWMSPLCCYPRLSADRCP